MKKCLVALIVLILLFPLGASVPKRSSVGIGNDMFSFGFSRNDDDQLSYSEVFGISDDRWSVKLNLDSVTNRGWKDSWNIHNEALQCKDGDLWYNGRYDFVSLLGSYSFNFDFVKNLDLYLEPKIGLAFVGNLNLQYFQNWFHEIRKIHHVSIPYDYDRFNVLTTLGAKTNLTYDFFKFENSIMKVSAMSDVLVTQQFRAEEILGLNLAIATNELTPFELTLGYSFNQSFSESKTEKLYSDHLNGYRFGFKVDTGLFSVEYLNSILSEYGYGIISVDPLCFLRPGNWDKSNLKFDLGVKTCFIDLYTSIAYEYCLNDDWSVYFEDSNVSGQPLSTVDELLNDMSVYGRQKKHNSLFQIGGRYYFDYDSSEGWVTPYASASVGFARWRQIDVTNTIKDALYPSKVNVDYLSFLTDFTVGALLFPEGMLVTDITTFQLNAYAGVMYLPKITQNYPKENNSHFSPVLGFSLKAGLDI